MPIYEYEREKCRARFEALVSIQNKGVKCVKCNSAKVKKLISTFSSGSSGASSCSIGAGT